MKFPLNERCFIVIQARNNLNYYNIYTNYLLRKNAKKKVTHI
jgi:hypothetical protein